MEELNTMLKHDRICLAYKHSGIYPVVSLISLLKPWTAESLAGSSPRQLFPELSSWSALHLQDAAHAPLLYRSRAAGAALCAHTPMHTECPDWNEGVSSNPCRGTEVPMAATLTCIRVSFCLAQLLPRELLLLYTQSRFSSPLWQPWDSTASIPHPETKVGCLPMLRWSLPQIPAHSWWAAPVSWNIPVITKGSAAPSAWLCFLYFQR